MSEDGDGIGIAAEGVDLGTDPPESLDLVPDPEVAGDVDVVRPQEACSCNTGEEIADKRLRLSFMILLNVIRMSRKIYPKFRAGNSVRRG